jgi:hypothetical protein
MPQGTWGWPPGYLDIYPFAYLKSDINRSSHKKTVPDHHHHGGLSNIPMEDIKRAKSAKCEVQISINNS